jgi:hypothetical protein
LSLISDFGLLFNNAKQYNEENSQIYKDANVLEKVLKTRWKSMYATMEARKNMLNKKYVCIGMGGGGAVVRVVCV